MPWEEDRRTRRLSIPSELICSLWFVKTGFASQELTFRQNTLDIRSHVQAIVFGYWSSGFPYTL